jgi:hypothetical protein
MFKKLSKCVTVIVPTLTNKNTDSDKNKALLDKKSTNQINLTWSSTHFKKKWTISFMNMNKHVKAEITWASN